MIRIYEIVVKRKSNLKAMISYSTIIFHKTRIIKETIIGRTEANKEGT